MKRLFKSDMIKNGGYACDRECRELMGICDCLWVVSQRKSVNKNLLKINLDFDSF